MALRRLLVLALVASCTSEVTPPPGRFRATGPKFDTPPPAATPTPAPIAAPTPTPTPVAVAPAAGASSCDSARFALAPDAVVGRVDGKDVLARDLGPELAKAEAAALREYCEKVMGMREQALDATFDERLIAAAAGAEKSGDPQAWMRDQLARYVEDPTDEEVASFYEQNKSDQSPPLDAVRDQVVAAILQERNQNAAVAILADLRKGKSIDVLLPDVRPPPIDLHDEDSTAGFGPKDAKVHVVEFSDFQCPYCARAASMVTDLKKKYGDRVRFSYRHFPLSFHPAARPAAEMAQCAQDQDKFWAFHDAVFAVSSELSDATLRRAAEDAGLDLNTLDSCLASGRAATQVDADMRKAEEAGVDGTPNFFLNGRALPGGPGQLAQAIEAELARG
ncbi:MAG: thioredoxin domain-containing protein [Nannocystaceae bacterium]|nr:thioredoxin domain-containing protein [Nannocystaceae bacterium]